MDWVILYNQGAQTFRAVAYDVNGDPQIPATANYTIVDLTKHEDATDREVQASTAATVDTASTTTTASAGGGTADPTRIQCTDGSSFLAGRRYLIQGADGAQEMFLVDHKSSNDLYADIELEGTYASGASVLGVEFPWIFPAATANDSDEIKKETLFGIDWVFTGVNPTIRQDYARIQRRPFPVLATKADIRNIDQTTIVAFRNRIKWNKCLVQANTEIAAEMRARGLDPHDHHLGRNGKLLAAWYAYWLGLRQVNHPSLEQKKVDARTRYRELRDTLLEGKAVQGTADLSRTVDTAWDSPNEYRSPFAES